MSDNSKYLDKKGLFDTIHLERLVITNLAGSALGHIFPDPPGGSKCGADFWGPGAKILVQIFPGILIFGADTQDQERISRAGIRARNTSMRPGADK